MGGYPRIEEGSAGYHRRRVAFCAINRQGEIGGLQLGRSSFHQPLYQRMAVRKRLLPKKILSLANATYAQLYASPGLLPAQPLIIPRHNSPHPRTLPIFHRFYALAAAITDTSSVPLNQQRQQMIALIHPAIPCLYRSNEQRACENLRKRIFVYYDQTNAPYAKFTKIYLRFHTFIRT